MHIEHVAQFDVYWWVAPTDPRLFHYRTKRQSDIECFSSTHYRFRAHPMDGDGDDEIELIIVRKGKEWMVKCDSFDDVEAEFPFACAKTDEGFVLTDVGDDELMIIRATCQ